MRILMVAPEAFFTPRGTPLSVYYRMAELEAIGHDIELLTYPVGEPPPGNLRARIHRSSGLPFVRRIKPGPSYLKIAIDLLLAVRLILLLRRHAFDVVYAHEEGGFIAALATWWFDIPYVYEMHSSLPAQIAEWHFSTNDLVRTMLAWVEQYTVRHARSVVTTSPGVEAIAREIEPAANILTLVNAYLLDSDVPAERIRQLRQGVGLGQADRVVLYTGSFVELQSLDLLVHAIPLVVRHEPRARFVFVGGRMDEIRRLRGLASSLGVSVHLRLEPPRPQTEMAAFMAAADVLVSPRVAGLNAPGKLICYLNSGRPVVATDCPVHNQILSRDTAILTRPTADGLATGILTAFEDRRLVRTITSNARQMIERTCDRHERIASYDRVFNGLCNSR